MMLVHLLKVMSELPLLKISVISPRLVMQYSMSQSFKKVPDFLNFSKTSVKIIYLSFIISFIYNIVGLSFAIGGMLSPIVAAIFNAS